MTIVSHNVVIFFIDYKFAIVDESLCLLLNFVKVLITAAIIIL